MPPSIQAVVFDLDGTLVDSEPVHADAWLSVLAEHGLEFDHHWFGQWVGLSDKHLAESVMREYQLNIPLETLRQQKQELYHQLALSTLRPFRGVKEGLMYFAENQTPVALATNSSRADVDQVFLATGLAEYLRAIVTADDVARLKPAPDVYLLAAERLSIAPQACVAVEDSPAGVAAARRAGMYVLGVATSQGPDRLEEANEIFDHTEEAITRIKGLLTS